MKLRVIGVLILAHDKSTLVVYGIPMVAFERGGVDKVLPLPDIACKIIQIVSEEGK